MPVPANKRRDIFGLIGFVALCAIISIIGGLITASSVTDWFQTLEKPVFSPPDWVFAPVWTILYLMIAIAGWRIWRILEFKWNSTELKIYAVQLGLNLGWSFLFFGLNLIGFSLVEILILMATIAANALVFWRVDRYSGLLLLPYLLWVSYASWLNFALWNLNS
jgi:benzodiazapine receptor